MLGAMGLGDGNEEARGSRLGLSVIRTRTVHSTVARAPPVSRIPSRPAASLRRTYNATEAEPEMRRGIAPMGEWPRDLFEGRRAKPADGRCSLGVRLIGLYFRLLWQSRSRDAELQQ